MYFKISDGFILIVDPTRIESVLLVEKQIERILRVSSHFNVYLIVNVNFTDCNFEKLKEIKLKFAETDKLIKIILDKYDIKIHYINLDNLKIFKKHIRKFLSLSYIKKGLSKITSNLKRNKKSTTLKTDRKSMFSMMKNEDEY